MKNLGDLHVLEGLVHAHVGITHGVAREVGGETHLSGKHSLSQGANRLTARPVIGEVVDVVLGDLGADPLEELLTDGQGSDGHRITE